MYMYFGIHVLCWCVCMGVSIGWGGWLCVVCFYLSSRCICVRLLSGMLLCAS